MKNLNSGWVRSAAVLSGLALALTACSGGDEPAEEPTSSPSTSASPSESPSPSESESAEATPSASESASEEPSESASPSEEATPSASETVEESAAAESSAAPATTAAPSTSAAAAPTEAACGSMSADEALAAVVASGHQFGDMVQYAEKDDYDPCADLSVISVPAGFSGTSAWDLQFFHKGEYAHTAMVDGALGETSRIDGKTLRFDYGFPREGDRSNAESSGVGHDVYTWDAATGTVTLIESKTNRDEAAPSASAAALPEVIHHADDVGFCFVSSDQVSCFGKHNNMAVLPANGQPTTEENVPAMGWEEPFDTRVLASGESIELGQITCTATAGGFDCTSAASGAGISVAGPEMSVTPPTN